MRLTIIILIVFVSGCGVTGQEYESAIEKCKDNNGIAFIMAPNRIEVTCNNGAMFVYKL